MGIPGGRRERGMSQRCLDEVRGRTAVEGVRGVGVAQPVGRDSVRDSGPPSCRPDDAPNLDL